MMNSTRSNVVRSCFLSKMLKTPDAAEITQAGRAYLQVGNNEIYELFQSAWSGADYQADKDEQQIEDHTIYLINDLGQYEILSEDLSGLENADDVKQIPTELDAIIDGIHEVAERENITPLPRPWLPPLEERIIATALHPVDFREEWLTEKQPLEPVLGVVDIPSMQAQETLRLNMTQEGHMTVFSSPGYGKSTFMQTVVMDLARVHSPERLNVYLLDFGTNGLLPLKKLPHVADTMGIDEEEKIEKFARRINDELKRRKKLLSEYSVASLEMYERASGKEEPIILILLDGFEGMKGAKFEEILEKVITQVAREGAGIGIHLLLSAGRQNSMRMTLASNIKTQVVLKMIDDSEPRAIVGRTTLTIDDLPGRGLIKLEEPELFQTALPAEGEDTLQIIEAIQEEVAQMDEHWTGVRPEPIPMVPEVLYFEEFRQRKQVQRILGSYGHIPIGLDFNLAEPVSINYVKHNTVLLTNSSEDNTDFLISTIKMASLKKDMELHIFDTQQFDLLDSKSLATSYLNEISDMAELVEEIHEEMADRQEEYLEEIKLNGTVSPDKFYNRYDEILLVWSRPLETYEQFDMQTKKLIDEIIDSEGKTGISLIFASQVGDLTKSYTDLAKKLKANSSAIIAMRMADQTVFPPHTRIMNEPILERKEAYLYESGDVCKIKIIE